MNAFSKSGSSGFSLIELLIGIAIAAVLVSLAMPSFKAMLFNSQIRNAAESIQNGLQKARAEAVMRNTNVEFVFNGTATDTAWQVNVVGSVQPIDKRISTEGSRDVTRTTVPGTATRITFDNTGRPFTTNPSDGSAPLTSIALSLPVTKLPTADSKPLTVLVNFGGQVRMCDPLLPAYSVTNPRGC